MSSPTKHFVTFYSPGALFAEETSREIDQWDVDSARHMARGIVERYGATPYCFQFTTRARGPEDFEPRAEPAVLYRVSGTDAPAGRAGCPPRGLDPAEQHAEQ